MDAPPPSQPDDAAVPPLPRMGLPYTHLAAASSASVPAAFPAAPPTPQVLRAPLGYPGFVSLPPLALQFGSVNLGPDQPPPSEFWPPSSGIQNVQMTGSVNTSEMWAGAISGPQQPRPGLPPSTTPTSSGSQIPSSQDAIKQAFFMDEAIMSVTFIKYIKPYVESMPLLEIHVPGDSRKHVTRSPQVRRGTCALVKWAIALYNAGYYLDGRFTGDDFGVDLFGNLKGKMSLIDLLKKVTTKEAKEILKNKMRFVADIVEEIHSSVDSKLQIPSDLNHLLLLLRQEDIAKSEGI